MNIRSHDSPVQTMQTMSVDIRLCGNIPRQVMTHQVLSQACSLRALTSQRSTPESLALNSPRSTESSTDHTIPVLSAEEEAINHEDHNVNTIMFQENKPLTPICDVSAPKWACAPKFESRLEPVCESLGRQQSVDLTKKASFRVGRSPNSDIQLMHATSSRRHAMLFHHSNGSCYVVDCGSAHGTYVNGTRVSPPDKGGVVLPFRVRRGALIRFGGPGAPCFVLKSFNFHLQDILSQAVDRSDMGELIRRNTRINALGKTAGEIIEEKLVVTIGDSLAGTRKRSLDTLDHDSTQNENPFYKRRCSSPPPSPEMAPPRLVSPDLPSIAALKRRRVSFSDQPPQAFFPASVTPDELSSEEDNTSL